MRDGIRKAHRNFLKEACYELYVHGREKEGQRWLKQLREKYPDALPANLSLPEYVVLRLTEDVKGGNSARVTSVVEGFIAQSYIALIEDRDAEATEYSVRAREIWEAYQRRIKNDPRLMPPPLSEMKQAVLKNLLDEKTGLIPEAADRLRKKLGLPAATPAPAPAKT